MPKSDNLNREQALALHQRGELSDAEAAYRRILSESPDDGLTWHYLAVLCGQRGDHAAVETCSRKAMACGHVSFSVLANLARSLNARGDRFTAAEAALQALSFVEDEVDGALEMVELLRDGGFQRSALDALRGLAKAIPKNVNLLDHLADCAIQVGAVTDAKNALADLRALTPDSADPFLNSGLLYFMTGSAEACASQTQNAIARDADCDRAWYLLSQLRGITWEEALQQELLDRATSGAGRKSPYLQFAAAKVLDVRGELDDAFAFFRRGNRLVRASYSYDVGDDERAIAVIANQCRSIGSPTRRETPAKSEIQPLFIVGMPRTGSTFLESQLVRHPAISSAGELVWLQRLVREALRELQLPFPQGMGSLPDQVLDRIRQQYLTLLRENVSEQGDLQTHCIDKLPANLLYLPVIRALFPGAPVVITRRDCAQTCLSCYFQLFSSPQYFAYDLAEAIRYWQAQNELINAIEDQHLPVTALVDLESVHRDPAKTLNGISTLCGLAPLDDAFSATPPDRLFRTASALQVRSSSVDPPGHAVTRYRRFLAPLLDQCPAGFRTDNPP